MVRHNTFNVGIEGSIPFAPTILKIKENYMNEPIIVCAAMLMDDGLIIPGVRHFSDEMRIILHKIYGDNYHIKVKEQGFIDQMGKFHNRSEAFKVANRNSQFRRPYGLGTLLKIPISVKESDKNILFSENLY